MAMNDQHDQPSARVPTVTRAENGRLLPGTAAINPGGRPAAMREYQEWLKKNALEPAQEALLACLKNPDGKVQMLAVKEVADRLFGKAPQSVTDADGRYIGTGILILPVEK